VSLHRSGGRLRNEAMSTLLLAIGIMAALCVIVYALR
jgi:hypothetical protein